MDSELMIMKFKNTIFSYNCEKFMINKAECDNSLNEYLQ
jgi:hypothetical protein